MFQTDGMYHSWSGTLYLENIPTLLPVTVFSLVALSMERPLQLFVVTIFLDASEG